MSSLAESMTRTIPPDPDNIDFGDDGSNSLQFHEACLEEIDRYRRLDQWIPSYHNILSTTALDSKARLMKAGIIPTSVTDFLHYTRDGCFDSLRLSAFSNLIDLRLIRKIPIAKWFLFALSNDPSPYIRSNLVSLFGQLLGSVAIGENPAPASQPKAEADELIIEQESSTTVRQAEMGRKHVAKVALKALRCEFGHHPAFKAALWQAVEGPLLSLDEIKERLHICHMLYDQVNSQIVVRKLPCYWRMISHGKKLVPASGTNASGKEVPSHVLTFIPLKKFYAHRIEKWTPKAKAAPSLKKEGSNSNTTTQAKSGRGILKPPKKPKDAGIGASRASPAASGENRIELGEEMPRPKVTLKLKLGPREN